MEAIVSTEIVDFRSEFAKAMGEAGLSINDLPEDDGQLHRFQVEGDKGRSRNGWYCLYRDGLPAGSFGSWKTGESHTWCAKTQKQMSAAEREAHQRRIEETKRQRKQEQARVYREASEASQALWEGAIRANPEHPYLVSKGIPPLGIRQGDDALLVPIRDPDQNLTSLQRIFPNGEKRFLAGGRIRGCYSSIGKPTETLYLCEGVATAISVNRRLSVEYWWHSMPVIWVRS